MSGIYEFVFGAGTGDEDSLTGFFGRLGFEPVQSGSLEPDEAAALYGHRASLRSIRLVHPGCAAHETGLVRLQFWSELRDEGLYGARPLCVGSRWMGIYTRDVLQVRDAFDNEHSRERWDLWLSPLVAAPLEVPPPEVTFDQPFVGLREQLVFGRDFRIAFIQRGGFDRPGFGTFDDSLPFKNTEGTHANIVQPVNSFSTAFYKEVFDLETAPFGEAHDSGTEEPTIQALDLDPDQTFHVERIRGRECPTGLLQVYSPYTGDEDWRDRSRPGSRNLCSYTFKVSDIQECAQRVMGFGGTSATPVLEDEFGAPAMAFDAPDGIAWVVCGHMD